MSKLAIALFGTNRPTRLMGTFRDMFVRLHALVPDLQLHIHAPFYTLLTEGDALPAELNTSSFTDFSTLNPALVVSIGGDGTLLATAAQVASSGIPVLAVNAGHLGYMTAATLDTAPEAIRRFATDGSLTVSPRTLISVTSPALETPLYALNEVALLKLNTASMITVCASVPGAQLATYSADGLIVATPTGSTGYNLSAGGPIIVPDAPVLVVSPIAPHSLTIRSLVLPDTTELTLTATSRSESFLLSVDGRSTQFPDSTPVILRKAPFTLNLVSVNSNPTNLFIDTLRSKLLWGADAMNDA